MDQPHNTYYNPLLTKLNIKFKTKQDSALHPVLDSDDSGTILLKAPRELAIGGLRKYTIDTGLSVEIPQLLTIQTPSNQWESTLDIVGEVFPLQEYARDYQLDIIFPKMITRTHNAQNIVLHLVNRGKEDFKIPQYSVFACIRFMYVPKLHVSLSVEKP